MLKCQRNYRAFFENSADAMLVIENGKFVECNSAAVTMLGYSCKEELINASPFKLSPEFQSDGRSSREKSIEMMQIAQEQGNHRFEWDHIRKNEDHLPVEVSLTRTETEGGFHFFTLWRDITERKQVEAAMAESEDIYKTILMASPDDITIADLSGRLLMFSYAATKMFGYDREDGPGMTILDFIVPEDHELARANMAKMVQNGHSGPNEYCAIRKDRSCFDIEVNSALIRDRQGNPFRMVLIARDITHRKKADQKIQELVGFDNLNLTSLEAP
ncbi:MAG: PAS domain-containing protein [Desulfuromonadales bacterium]|nr:PAS domain-containing protein [Desulfuromonadales bacterium]